MSDVRDVKITLNEGGTGGVLVDDMDLTTSLCGFNIHSRAGKTCEVTLDLATSAYEFEGQARIGVTDEVRDLLVSLGWTPPAPATP